MCVFHDRKQAANAMHNSKSGARYRFAETSGPASSDVNPDSLIDLVFGEQTAQASEIASSVITQPL
jgi:hypothetical protein